MDDQPLSLREITRRAKTVASDGDRVLRLARQLIAEAKALAEKTRELAQGDSPSSEPTS